MRETKPFAISKRAVWAAYRRVKENRGVAHWRFGVKFPAGGWEPDDLRGSRPILRGPWGETPQGYSPGNHFNQFCSGHGRSSSESV